MTKSYHRTTLSVHAGIAVRSTIMEILGRAMSDDLYLADEAFPVLAADVPVVMPELPAVLIINTSEQYKALGDATRTRILSIIKHQPTTAKQLATKLGIAPGTVGHHLQALETAGLAQVVARRLVRGIVAKYYTRTARLLQFEQPLDGGETASPGYDMMADLRDEIAEVVAAEGEKAVVCVAFPHARLTPERMRVYQARLDALIVDFAQEPPAPDGLVYGLGTVLFRAPQAMQPNTSGNDDV